MTAASLLTSVPVIPIAMPMSAFFRAGASFTPSPVIATMWPFFLRTSTRRTLCSGVTRAMTPTPSISRSASSSLMAPNSAPVIARPSIPRSVAIACAVTAWSPVIIRTWMPAAFAVAIEAFAAGRGGSTMPTRVRSVRPSTRGRRSAAGSNVAGSKSFRAVDMTRRPFSPSRWFSSRYCFFTASSTGAVPDRSGVRMSAARARSWSGAPLTKQRTTSFPASSFIRWKVAMSLYAASNGSSAMRGYSCRVRTGSIPPLAASTTRAPSVGSPISSPSFTTASAHNAIGSRKGSSGTSAWPPTLLIWPSV